MARYKILGEILSLLLTLLLTQHTWGRVHAEKQQPTPGRNVIDKLSCSSSHGYKTSDVESKKESAPKEDLITFKLHDAISKDGMLGTHVVHSLAEIQDRNSTIVTTIAYGNSSKKVVTIEVAGFQWNHVRQPFIVCMVILVSAILRVGFHHAGRLPEVVPESCLLILLGIAIGGVLSATGSTLFSTLSPSFFFLILLPPIILDSAYNLYDRVFAENIGTVLLYAVVGTILNCILLGPTLYGLARAGAMGSIDITFSQCLLFASFIIAVDPVAVLAIFQEIGVNNVLYFLVFGESLLNDAVTVVLYNMMQAFTQMESPIPVAQIFLAIVSFFTISLLGAAIGILYGITSALITRFTPSVRMAEPIIVLMMAYASYLTADLFKFSGILSIFCCGLIQSHFTYHNISEKSSTFVFYLTKILGSTSDFIIFIFLGMALWTTKHIWHTGFVLWTLLLCLVYRFFVVGLLTFLANKFNRLRKIGLEEQFIMAYGGLRGAVAFSLVTMLNKDVIPERLACIFETTTLVVILFTVFVQGTTIKPLVKLLRIKKKGNDVISLFAEVNKHVNDHVMAGVEEIIGHSGRHTFRAWIWKVSDQYMKKILQRDPVTKEDLIVEAYKEVAIQDHYNRMASTVDMRRYSNSVKLYSCKGEDATEKAKDLNGDLHLQIPPFERQRDTSITIIPESPESALNVALKFRGSSTTISDRIDSLSSSDISLNDMRKLLNRPKKLQNQRNMQQKKDVPGMVQRLENRQQVHSASKLNIISSLYNGTADSRLLLGLDFMKETARLAPQTSRDGTHFMGDNTQSEENLHMRTRYISTSSDRALPSLDVRDLRADPRDRALTDSVADTPSREDARDLGQFLNRILSGDTGKQSIPAIRITDTAGGSQQSLNGISSSAAELMSTTGRRTSSSGSNISVHRTSVSVAGSPPSLSAIPESGHDNAAFGVDVQVAVQTESIERRNSLRTAAPVTERTADEMLCKGPAKREPEKMAQTYL